jgi:ribonuclease P protein component
LSTCCFKTENRLQKSSQFKYVANKGKRLKNPFFIVVYKNKQPNEAPRLGITVSKKCSKKAVERNRLKRIVRESFRTNRESFSYLDVVVIGRRQAVEADNTILFKELGRLWRKLEERCG